MSADDEGFTDMWIIPPCSGPITRPRATVSAPITGDVNQNTDNSVGKKVNGPMPWVALACLFGGLGFGGMVVLCLLKPWEASDRAAQAELRAEFAQELATVRVEAHNAASISEVWRNRVNKLEAEANANRRR